MAKPFVLNKKGSKWNVFVDPQAAARFGAKKSGLKGFGTSGLTPITRNEGKIGWDPAGQPASFTKEEAEHVAHMIGRYKFGFGDLVYTYAEEIRDGVESS